MIQGRRLCKDGSEVGVGKGTVVRGREGTVSMWQEESQARSPRCPVCPLVQSDSFLPGLSNKESREYNASSPLGHHNRRPVGEAALCGGWVPDASLTSHGVAFCKSLHLFGPVSSSGPGGSNNSPSGLVRGSWMWMCFVECEPEGRDGIFIFSFCFSFEIVL